MIATFVGVVSGIKIYLSPSMPRQTERRVANARSPSRATRRARRGFPQCFKTVVTPIEVFRVDDTLYVHPDVWPALKASFENRSVLVNYGTPDRSHNMRRL